MRFSPPSQLLAVTRRYAAAWLTVVIVLFCALLPAGLPLTAPQGSAFNPATTSVALASRGPERHETTASRLEPSRDEVQPLPYLLILLPIAALLSSCRVIAKPAGPETTSLLAQLFASARRARAPPA